MKKKIVIVVVVLAIIGGFYYFTGRKAKTEYTTVTALRGTLNQTVSVTGEVRALEQTDLAFKISGRIENMFVKVGDRVTKGQKVATIDKGTLWADLEQARQEVKAQKETYDNYKRRDDTYNKDQRRAQRAELRKAEAAVNEVLIQLRETTLYAPISGIIISKNVEEGEITVANAVTSNTSVVTVAREGDLEMESNVPESDIVKVKLGQSADVTLDALGPDEILKAHISEIDPASTVVQDVVYYRIKLAFEKVDPRLKIGMSSNIDVRTNSKDNVLMIPSRALKTENGKKYVEVLKENDVVDKAYVTTGLEGDDGMVEVISGLNEGDKVITFTKTQ